MNVLTGLLPVMAGSCGAEAPEHCGEILTGGEAEAVGNLCDGEVCFLQQLFRTLNLILQDIFTGGNAQGFPEMLAVGRKGEIIHGGKLGYPDGFLGMGMDVLETPGNADRGTGFSGRLRGDQSKNHLG